MTVIAAANARRGAGLTTVSLCAGEPTAGAPAPVRRRAAELAVAGTLGYTEALGTPALREAIAAHYDRWYGLAVEPAEVAVTTGSSGAFLLAFLAAFDVGDRVVLARPGYPAYRNILTALGCDVVEVGCGPATRYQLTAQILEDLVARTGPVAGVVAASPANPTGTMIPPDELRALDAWCSAHDARLISDEIYHGITYGEPVSTAWESSRDGVVINSFSKYFGMTGWRLGWMLVPPDLRSAVDALAGNFALSPPALSQLAAVEAFSPASYAEADANVARYRESRAMVLGALPRLGWGRCAPADGAFYIYAELDDATLAGDEAAQGAAGRGGAAAVGASPAARWCRRALDEAGVALTPGTDFDRVDGGRWVRLSFSAPPDVVGDAVDRLVAWADARRA
jgi:aspartate/methionine/tyrosine aminotransferase